MDWCQTYSLVKDWQTLLAALLALLAAWWTITTMKKQMQQSDAYAEDIRRRKERAARAALPGALSSLIEYARASGVLPATLRPAIESHETGRHANENVRNAVLPTIPQEALAVLKECIEFSHDGPAERMAEIFRALQIQNSGLVDLVASCKGEEQENVRLGGNTVATIGNADTAIFDAACLHARIENLFNYARAETDTVPDHIKQPEVERALFHFGIFQEQFADVYRMVESKFQNSD